MSEYIKTKNIENLESGGQQDNSKIDPRDSYSKRFKVQHRAVQKSIFDKNSTDGPTKRKSNLESFSKSLKKNYKSSSLRQSLDKIQVQQKKTANIERQRERDLNNLKQKLSSRNDNENDQTIKNNQQVSSKDNREFKNKLSNTIRSHGLDALFANTANVKKDDNILNKPNTKSIFEKSDNKDTRVQTNKSGYTANRSTFKSQNNTNELDNSESSTSFSKENEGSRNFIANYSNIRVSDNERKLKVVTPDTYNSAKDISIALKAGNAVVLNLNKLNRELKRKLLDFSFGCASMVNAYVTCEGKDIYSITIGQPLTTREIAQCKNQGISIN